MLPVPPEPAVFGVSTYSTAQAGPTRPGLAHYPTPSPWLLQSASKSQTTASSAALQRDGLGEKTAPCKSLEARPVDVLRTCARSHWEDRSGHRRRSTAGGDWGCLWPGSRRIKPGVPSSSLRGRKWSSRCGAELGMRRTTVRRRGRGRCGSSGVSETSTCTPILDLTTQSSLVQRAKN